MCHVCAKEERGFEHKLASKLCSIYINIQVLYSSTSSVVVLRGWKSFTQRATTSSSELVGSHGYYTINTMPVRGVCVRSHLPRVYKYQIEEQRVEEQIHNQFCIKTLYLCINRVYTHIYIYWYILQKRGLTHIHMHTESLPNSGRKNRISVLY